MSRKGILFGFFVAAFVISPSDASRAWARSETVTIESYFPVASSGSSGSLSGNKAAIGTTYKNNLSSVADNNLVVQGSVGIGTSSPDPATALTVHKTSTAGASFCAVDGSFSGTASSPTAGRFVATGTNNAAGASYTGLLGRAAGVGTGTSMSNVGVRGHASGGYSDTGGMFTVYANGVPANGISRGLFAHAQALNTASGSIGELLGGSIGAMHDSPQPVLNFGGLRATVHKSGSGSASSMYGVRTERLVTKGTVSDSRGLVIENVSIFGPSAAVTNNYGLYIDNQTGGATNYAIYAAGGQSYFAGNVGIGTTAPDAKLSFGGKQLITFNRDTPTETAGNIIGGLGFWGFGQSHGQFHYRAAKGFEMLDVSNDGSSITHASTSLAPLYAGGLVIGNFNNPGNYPQSAAGGTVLITKPNSPTNAATPSLRLAGNSDNRNEFRFDLGANVNNSPYMDLVYHQAGFSDPLIGTRLMHFPASGNIVSLMPDGNGNVGIGTEAPTARLQVAGGDAIFDNNVGMGVAPSSGFRLMLPNTPSNAGAGIARGWILYSSRRWKTNIRPIQDALGTVERLQGVTFDWKEGGKHDVGLIAEEVGQVIPELVTYEANSVDATGVDYAKLTAVLIEAVKLQQRHIEALQAEVAALKKRRAE